MFIIMLCVVGIAMSAFCPLAAGLNDIALPESRMGGGKPLMETLKERQSVRVFRPHQLRKWFSRKAVPLYSLLNAEMALESLQNGYAKGGV